MKASATVASLAGEVCQALRSRNVEAILVGGAAVTIHTGNRYRSYDLDFVVRGKDQAVIEGMASIGYRKGGGRHYERAGSRYIVEFLSPPVGVGRKIVQRFLHLRTPRGRLTMLTPTDCVMDRLSAYYHWNDEQSFEQAVMVARSHRIRWGEVKRWSEAEGMSVRFAEFRSRYLKPIRK